MLIEIKSITEAQVGHKKALCRHVVTGGPGACFTMVMWLRMRVVSWGLQQCRELKIMSTRWSLWLRPSSDSHATTRSSRKRIAVFFKSSTGGLCSAHGLSSHSDSISIW